jgi:hypothetical protein
MKQKVRLAERAGVMAKAAYRSKIIKSGTM